MATAGLSIIKLSSASLAKLVNPAFYEVGETIHYQLQYANTSDNPISDIRLLDVLPYMGDGRGTDFDGSYRLSNVITLTGNGTGAIELYYTTNTAVRGNTAVSYTAAQITGGADGFTQATRSGSGVGTPYTYTIPAGTDVAAIVMLGSLPAQSLISLEIPLEVTNNKPGNIYGNNATMVIGTSSTNVEAPRVQARVVNRTVSGVVWDDSDLIDGRRGVGEPFMEHVTVRLLEKQSDNSYAQAVDVLGNTVADATTDSSGSYSFTNLAEGTYRVVFLGNAIIQIGAYTLTEQEAAGVPASLNSDAEEVLDSDGVLVEAVIKEIELPALADIKTAQFSITNLDAGLYKNEPGSLTVYKVDAVDTSIMLEGMEFNLYRMVGAVKHYYSVDIMDTVVWSTNQADAYVFTTRADGKLELEDGGIVERIEDLAWGVYYIEEIAAPYGYEMLVAPVAVSIHQVDIDVEVTISNTRKLGSIQLEKVDAEAATIKLENVEFILYQVVAGNKVYYRDTAGVITWETDVNDATVLVSDINGELPQVDDLLWGTYYYEEIQTIEGYVLLENPVEITIDRDHVETAVYQTVANKRQTGSIEVLKVDAENAANALGNAEFVVYQRIAGRTYYTAGAVDTDGHRTYTENLAAAEVYTTAANGKVFIDNLAWGTYYVREIKAPDGYVLDETEQEVIITKENAINVKELTFKNERIKVEIIKVDERGTRLGGARLAVIDKDGNTVAEWVSTTSAYVLDGVLRAGERYSLRELSAPAGYLLAADLEFTTNLDNQRLTVTLINQREPEPSTEPPTEPPTETETDDDGDDRTGGASRTTPPAPGGRTTGTGVGAATGAKAGDRTAMLIYAAGLALGLAVITAVIIRKRRRV